MLLGGGCCPNKQNQTAEKLQSKQDNKEQKEEKSRDMISNQETDVESPIAQNPVKENKATLENENKNEENEQAFGAEQSNQLTKPEEVKINKSEEINYIPLEFQIKDESKLEKLRRQIKEQNNKDIIKQVGKYALRQKLGVGAFGKVYLATLKDLEQQITFYAIKEMPLRSGPTSKIVRCLLTKREINNMIRVQHTNIVQLIDVVFTSNNCYLVMEYCEGGNLKEFFSHNLIKSFITQPQLNIKLFYISQHSLLQIQGKNVLKLNFKRNIKNLAILSTRQTQERAIKKPNNILNQLCKIQRARIFEHDRVFQSMNYLMK